MRLEDLDYFLAVARAGHVGRAADGMGISQPALTKGIRRLEEALQLQLFVRTPKGMELTMPGKVFYQRSLQARRDLDDALREAGDLHRGSIGLVRVGVTPLLVDPVFNGACVDLMAQRPAAKINVTVSLNDALIPALRQGQLDFSISSLHDSAAPAEFDRIPLFRDSLFVAARAGHPLFDRAKIRFDHLIGFGWMLPGLQVASRRWLETRFEQRGAAPPEIVIESNSSVSSLVSVLHGTDLLTVISEITLRSEAGKGLSAVPLEDVTWHREIGIMTRRGGYLSPLAQRFIEILRERAAKRAAR
ncbi:hypothetical protein CEK29_08160 [Bordetella genomosp. 5]|uniref:HTH lysR-type domain-containing protein n=1 Tax=Bordetella genomosp. 5 TaxID=1395608 RepID=A0A261TV60_9BORD|nr:LysR family transcriptional regulator [Bordetella genomosp. 5]OZI44670.1 hypothetical protein CEK29_08160 [Bordetella genomosp. 5]OZI53574.1 hypothetical protein CAL25_06255 [Bordetella genomosp. 5]